MRQWYTPVVLFTVVFTALTANFFASISALIRAELCVMFAAVSPVLFALSAILPALSPEYQVFCAISFCVFVNQLSAAVSAGIG